MVGRLAILSLLAFVAVEGKALDLDDRTAIFHDPVLNIVGGSDASQGQFPWQLRLTGDNNALVCGAVLVASNRALTAAHCVGSGPYKVTCGEHQPGVSSGDKQTLTVSSVTKHPDYNTGPGYPNDIAILKLSGDFKSNGKCKPILMADKPGSDFIGYSCFISGWGRVNGGGSLAPTLKYAVLPAISNWNCGQRWASVSGVSINDGHICVYQSGKSACSGDSGGPMVCNQVLAGITSWGISSCSGSYPSVYSRVSYFRDWLDANM